MAQRFLDQLPKVPDRLLSNVTECMICREAYGTVPSDNGTIEHAVLLPCLHHVGSECIAIWLSPDNGLGNSCPLCRTVFFPIRVWDYEDEDDGDDDDGSDDSDSDSGEDNDHENEGGNEDDGSGDSDEEKEEEENDEGDEGDEDHQEEDRGDDSGSEDQSERSPTTLLDAFRKVASCSASTHAHEETQRQDGQWFERWPLPTAEQIDTIEKRARLHLLRPPPPPPSIFPHTSTSPSQSTHTPPPPADLETNVAHLASAYRTMAFRETLLYVKLTEAGARMPPLRAQNDGAGLSPYQEEMLLWELGQRGAFADARVRPGYLGMTNRQAWSKRRAEGEVFTFGTKRAGGRGYWSAELGFGLSGG